MKSNNIIRMSVAVVSVFLFSVSAQQSQKTNTFDAFTSASTALKIIGGTIYGTYAEIQWAEWYENEPHIDAYLLRWGTQPDQFTDTLQLRPYENKKIINSTITPLSEGTTYYAQFYRVWEEETVVKTDFYFNTPPLPDPVRTPFPFRPLRQNTDISSFTIYSLDGKSVYRGKMNPSDNHTFSILNPASSGIYLIRLHSGKTATSTTRWVIQR